MSDQMHAWMTPGALVSRVFAVWKLGWCLMVPRQARDDSSAKTPTSGAMGT
jgi:hypothetical protein